MKKMIFALSLFLSACVVTADPDPCAEMRSAIHALETGDSTCFDAAIAEWDDIETYVCDGFARVCWGLGVDIADGVVCAQTVADARRGIEAYDAFLTFSNFTECM